MTAVERFLLEMELQGWKDYRLMAFLALVSASMVVLFIDSFSQSRGF